MRILWKIWQAGVADGAAAARWRLCQGEREPPSEGEGERMNIALSDEEPAMIVADDDATHPKAPRRISLLVEMNKFFCFYILFIFHC